MILTLSNRSNVTNDGTEINPQSAQAYVVQFASPIILPADAEIALLRTTVNKSTAGAPAGGYPLAWDYNSVFVRIPELQLRSAHVKDANSNQLMLQSIIGQPVYIGASAPATALAGEHSDEISLPIYQRVFNHEDISLGSMNVELIHVDGSPANELTLSSEVTLHIRKHSK